MHGGADVKTAASYSQLGKGVPMLARGVSSGRMGFLRFFVLLELVISILLKFAGLCPSARMAGFLSIGISCLWLHAFFVSRGL